MVSLKFVKMVIDAFLETHELTCPKCKTRLKLSTLQKKEN